MGKYDATAKRLIETYPADWLAQFGTPGIGEVTVRSPDLSTVSSFADTLIEQGGRLHHIGVQAASDATAPKRCFEYNSLAHIKTGKGVESTLLLLTKKANSSSADSLYRHGGPQYRTEFRYRVPAEQLLAGGTGVLPLAALGKLPDGVAPEEVIGQMVKAIRAAEAGKPAAELLSSAFIMTGLGHDRRNVLDWFTLEFRGMEESTTYQYIIEQGFERGESRGVLSARRDILTRIAANRFGVSAEQARPPLDAIDDLARLDRMIDATYEAADWDTVLGTA